MGSQLSANYPEVQASAPNQAALSRRNFLKMSGVTLGGAVLACSGTSYLATRQPNTVELIQSTCGGETTMKEKILVTYATKAGSTGEIAQAIGQVFCERGAIVDVRPLKTVRSLDGYRAVVIGSAIRMGRWLPEAVKFVEQHKTTLEGLPSAYFLVSLFLREGTPEIRQTVSAYLDPVRAIHEPEHIGMFPGKMDYSKLSWFERQAAKMVKAPEGDYRDWEAVHSWALELAQDGFGAAGA